MERIVFAVSQQAPKSHSPSRYIMKVECYPSRGLVNSPLDKQCTIIEKDIVFKFIKKYYISINVECSIENSHIRPWEEPMYRGAGFPLLKIMNERDAFRVPEN